MSAFCQPHQSERPRLGVCTVTVTIQAATPATVPATANNGTRVRSAPTANRSLPDGRGGAASRSAKPAATPALATRAAPYVSGRPTDPGEPADPGMTQAATPAAI